MWLKVCLLVFDKFEWSVLGCIQHCYCFQGHTPSLFSTSSGKACAELGLWRGQRKQLRFKSARRMYVGDDVRMSGGRTKCD